MAYLLTAISVFLESMKILKKMNPDVVVLNYPSPYTGLLGFLEGKLLRKAVILDFSDLIAQYSIDLLKLRQTDFKARLIILAQNYIVRKSRFVVVPTSFIKKYAISLRVPERKISVIPNGVDTRVFDPKKHDAKKIKSDLKISNEKLCIYCGRLDGWAGITIISRVSQIALDKKLNIRFILIGSGSAKTIQEENVNVLGEIVYKNVPAFLATADAILIPFPSNEVSQAASPLKLFEGMAMQKPVVASKVSGIKDVVSDGKNGFLANSDDPNAWIEKLENILNSEQIATLVAKNARRTVEERFDWRLLAKQYEEIVKNESDLVK